jgi:hypothetical protein
MRKPARAFGRGRSPRDQQPREFQYQSQALRDHSFNEKRLDVYLAPAVHGIAGQRRYPVRLGTRELNQEGRKSRRIAVPRDLYTCPF